MKRMIDWASLTACLLMVLAAGVHAQNAVISIEDVTYTAFEDDLRAGHVHTVTIRYNCLNLSSDHEWSAANGFEIYSPEGADWGYLKATVGPLVDEANPGAVYLTHFEFDGSDWTHTADDGLAPAGGSGGPLSRATFYLTTLSFWGDDGYIGGTHNDIAVTFEFTTDPAECDQSFHICIDTAAVLDHTGFWEWHAGSDTDIPVWDNGLGTDGPRCWEIKHDCCCSGRTGDADLMGGDEPTLADIAAMIDAKFISSTCTGVIECLQEADVDNSGGHVPLCDDITLSDISILIDYLFVTGPELGLPDCQ